MLVKWLWIAVAVIWFLNFVLSCVARSKQKKAARAAAKVTVAEEADVTDES